MIKNVRPHQLGKKQLTDIIRRLQEARRAATMERMSVSNICAPGNKLAAFEDGSAVLENNVNEFIRERTRLYRDTWVVSPIEDVIDELVTSIYGSGTERI